MYGVSVGLAVLVDVTDEFRMDGWFTMPYGFTDRMSEVVGGFTGACDGILLGRKTFEMFGPAWSERTVDDDPPGAPFFNETTKYVVSGTLDEATAGRTPRSSGGRMTRRRSRSSRTSTTCTSAAAALSSELCCTTS